jgi:hypothetical protein
MMAGQKGEKIMKTFHKDYLCSASITDKADGTARLIIRIHNGKKVKDSIHKNRAAAYSAWRRFCN